MFRPVSKSVQGPDGKIQRKIVKKEYFVCDIGLGGGGRLNQTKLSFSLVLRTQDTPENQEVNITRRLATTSEGNTYSTAATNRAGINSDDETGEQTEHE